MFRSRRLTARFGPVLLAAAAACAQASDLDALDLQSAPVEDKKATASAAPGRWLLEAAAGTADQRYGLGRRSISRLSADVHQSLRLAPEWRAVGSARLDATRPEDPRVENPVLSLREAYVGWQDAAGGHMVEGGRINQRSGPGYGYNPTDFLRENSLRTIVTVNPLSQRENRLGTALLRWQHLGAGQGWSLLLAPKLARQSAARGLSPDWGRTNASAKGQIAYTVKLGDQAQAQGLLFKEEGRAVQVGANLSALLSDAWVLHAEWAQARQASLLDQALLRPGVQRSGHRAVLGLTYSTPGQLSLTAEWQSNRFALDKTGWQALAGASVDTWAAYHGLAQDRQDLASRSGVLLYAVQKDLLLKRLDLTGLLKLNTVDHSSLGWLELRYRFDGIDVAVQWQQHRGTAESEFGLNPIRRTVGLIAAAYF